MLFSELPRLAHPLVHLRPLTEADLEPWFAYLTLPQVHEHTSWDVRAASDLAHNVWHPESTTDASTLRFAVASRSDDRLVGSAGFHTVQPRNRSAELAYDLAPEVWGQGVGSAVCAELTRWAHAAASVVRVQATVLDTNARSIAVLERCGFEREGLLRAFRTVRGRHGDFYVYSHVVLPPG